VFNTRSKEERSLSCRLSGNEWTDGQKTMDNGHSRENQYSNS